MNSDKVLLEILNNRFTGIVEEMGYVIHRAAFTTFVKETWDFDSALLTPNGDVFAYPRNIGVTNMLAIDLSHAISCFDSYKPGDVVLTNDPFHTRGMSTHLPDLMVFKPIFWGEEIVCFAWCFLHSSDVGGMVPGSIAPQASDRFQEGVVIPPVKLYKKGLLDDEIRRLVLSNCRIPEQNWGDLQALVAALHIAERRLNDVLVQYGPARFTRVINDLLDYGEERARKIFEAVPDGEYEFSDYLEGDLFGRYHLRMKLKLVVTGSEVLLDFTGSDPEVPAAPNLPTFGKLNQFLVLGIVNFLRTSDPHLPFNRGVVRPVEVRVPNGSFLNPSRNAATGVRYTTALRVSDVVMGALSKAVPDRIPAAGSGQMGILTLSDLDADSGSYKLHVLEPLQGGSGGRATKDGIDGMNFSGGALRNAPVEALEIDAPILVTKYMLSEEVSAGQYRGGAGVVFEFQTLSPHAMVTSRGWDRFRIRPWGRFGGQAGPLGNTVTISRDGAIRQIQKIESLRLEAGQMVRITSPGGAGYGDPLDRDPNLVWNDYLEGFVSLDSAATLYGVVANTCGIDMPATKLQRQSMRSRVGSEPDFDFGPERAEYESDLPEATQDLVNEMLQQYPATNRYNLRELLYEAVVNGLLNAADQPALAAFVAEVAQRSREPHLSKAALGGSPVREPASAPS